MRKNKTITVYILFALVLLFGILMFVAYIPMNNYKFGTAMTVLTFICFFAMVIVGIGGKG